MCVRKSFFIKAPEIKITAYITPVANKKCPLDLKHCRTQSKELTLQWEKLIFNVCCLYI